MFRVDSNSSSYNDNGTVLCKTGKMFYEDSLISNITARCNESATWSFNSSKLHCYRGLVLAYKIYRDFNLFIYSKKFNFYSHWILDDFYLYFIVISSLRYKKTKKTSHHLNEFNFFISDSIPFNNLNVFSI